MALTLSDAAGFLGGICTTISFLPQVVKTWRSRSARDISFGMYCLLLLGIGFWLVHGVMIGSWPIIVANAVTLLLVGSMLYMKIRYK